jgi:hypothetical protein
MLMSGACRIVMARKESCSHSRILAATVLKIVYYQGSTGRNVSKKSHRKSRYS